MVNIAERGKKGLVAHCHCDYNAAFAGGATRLGVAADAGLVFGQVKARKGCVGGGFMGRGSGIEKVAGRGPRGGAGLEPVTFESACRGFRRVRGPLGGDPLWAGLVQ